MSISSLVAQAGSLPVAPTDVEINCDVADALIPARDFVIGNFLGVSFTLGRLLIIVAIGAIVFLAFSKKLNSLVRGIAIAFLAILVTGILITNPDIIPGPGC